MHPFVHRVWIPPVLVGLYVVLLLPIFLVPPLDSRGATTPGQDHMHSLTYRDLPWSSSELQADRKSVLRRLHPQFSLPLAFLGFLVVSILRLGLDKVLLPKDSRWERRAAVKWVMLFVMGGIEEIWRWGLVRWLVDLVGGRGGFRGRGPIWDLILSTIEGVNALDGSKGKPQILNTKGPSIWESVYLMGWTWSVFDCVVLWLAVCPIFPSEAIPIQRPRNDSPVPPIVIRRDSRGEIDTRRPLLGKRTRSDYSIVASDDVDEGRTLFGSFYRRRRELKTPKLRKSISGQGMVHFAEMPTYTEDNAAECSATAGAERGIDTARLPAAAELRRRLSTELNQGPVRHHREEQEDSDDDDERSFVSAAASSARSSSDSGRYQSQTPLLSSSLPYDPSQQHPHHEEQALLQNRYRTRSYGSMSDSIAISFAVENDDAIVAVHEDDDSAPVQTELEDEIEDEGEPARVGSPSTERSHGRRVYPSFPSYTSAYHHAYFPATSPVTGPESPSNQTRRHCRQSRVLFGMDVNELPFYYAVIWATTNLLGHLAHVMFFSWAPALVFEGNFMWWTFFVILLLVCKKGIFTAELFGGSAKRMGLLGVSIVSLGLAILVYIISLGVWGIIW